MLCNLVLLQHLHIVLYQQGDTSHFWWNGDIGDIAQRTDSPNTADTWSAMHQIPKPQHQVVIHHLHQECSSRNLQ